MADMSGSSPGSRGGRNWRWLFVLPFLALLWVPLYNRVEPTLWGFPFFYWYQFVWLFLTSGLIIFVLLQEKR